MMLPVCALLLTCLFGVATLAAQKPAAKPVAKPPTPDAGKQINTPRPDARTVTFETHEGTWMSVDVSPDGSTIVFDLLGDLYTLPIAGGTATAISRGPAYDHHPRFSPDGKTIAFTTDEGGMENLWIADANGANRRPLDVGGVAGTSVARACHRCTCIATTTALAAPTMATALRIRFSDIVHSLVG